MRENYGCTNTLTLQSRRKQGSKARSLWGGLGFEGTFPGISMLEEAEGLPDEE